MASNLPPFPPEPPGVMPPPPPTPPEAPPAQAFPPGSSDGTPPSGEPPLPWEQPGYPALEGLFETATMFITKPGAAFARMSVTGDLSKPLIYAVIFGWIGVIASQIYNLAFRGAMKSFMPFMSNTDAFDLPWGFNVGVMVVAPILVLIGVFITSAILHLFVMLVGANNKGFSATMRVVCYASTVQILQVVPFCGGLIGGIWGIVLDIIGLAAAHRTTTGKAALAVLLPIALCCMCAVVVALAFGAMIMGAISHLR